MKSVTFEELITEVNEYITEVFGYNEELLSLAHLIMSEQIDKLKENTANTVNAIKLSDQPKELGINNIDDFSQNQNFIDISSESAEESLVQVLDLSGIAAKL